MPAAELTDRFQHALVYATQLHAGQIRKGSGVPYVSHLLAVASLVLESGGDEDEAIAALLHDGPEDQGGLATLAEIRKHFGQRVAGIVAECSDSFEAEKPPWRTRKLSYLAHLKQATRSARYVSCADKLHNARSVLMDYRLVGEAIWQRFRGGREGTLWYYRALVDAFTSGDVPVLAAELARTVRLLEQTVGSTVEE